jgi:hypothetical protein
MKTEYSPAPWSHEPLQATQGADIAIVGSGQVIAVIQHDPDIQTAAEDEIDGDNVVWTAEDLANARLIAAAPELLAACEKLASIAEEFKAGARSGYHMGTISQAMDLALAAITRAKGGA